MTAPTPNAELAWRVLDHIDAHPEQWWQLLWISRPAGPDCGTAGCFAGWTCMLSGDQPAWKFAADEETMNVLVGGSMRLVGERARELLGIGEEQIHELFYEQNSREDLGRLVAEIFGPRPAPADAYVGPYGVANWRAPLTEFERRAGVVEPAVEMQPPPCADHQQNELNCAVCTAQRRAFYAALGRES